MDPRAPRIKLRTHQLSRLMGQRLLVQVDAWERGMRFPSGHYVRALGPAGDAETEVAALLLEHDAAFPPFSARALACLPRRGWRDSGWTVPEEDSTARKDLRGGGYRVFSVDPPGCQDIDDAMHVREIGGSGMVRRLEVGVHIADVARFVAHGSPLDREARQRGTTTYLSHRRFDMLPALLAGDICSLHGGRDRLAVSVFWEVEQLEDGKGLPSQFGQNLVIRSVAAMTYDQAHTLITKGRISDQPPVPPGQAGAPVPPDLHPPLSGDLKLLTLFARWLRQQRSESGALDLTKAEGELKFKLHPVTGLPVAVTAKAELEINHTIAELMILANRTVAETVLRAFPSAALLRTHAPVQASRLGLLQEVAAAAGISVEVGSGGALQASLERSQAARGAGVGALLKSLATRVMSEAVYVCTGTLDEHSAGGGVTGERLSHFGLGIGSYTHFTSPIRRYADVVVHRLLLAATGLGYAAEAAPSADDAGAAAATVTAVTAVETAQEEAAPPALAAGLGDLDGDDLIDALLDMGSDDDDDGGGNAQQKGGGDVEVEEGVEVGGDVAVVRKGAPFGTLELARVCEHLNSRTRGAKQLSQQCQELFLRLHFMNRVRVVDAVVMSLKANGFLAYIPAFDTKGPVFLADKSGVVQMAPQLLRLPADSGGEPAQGFAMIPNCRALPHARLVLQEGTPQELRVEVEKAAAVTFHVPMVVQLYVTCDVQPHKARLPDLRFGLA
ncbi:hypothetical protein JKP88DRAFT_192931, partial [Tribonema minus]